MKLQIKDIDHLRDGGTVEIKCSDATYYIDYRLMNDKNQYRGMLFNTYPTSQSTPLPKNEAKEIKRSLLFALRELGVRSQKYQYWLPKLKEIHV